MGLETAKKMEFSEDYVISNIIPKSKQSTKRNSSKSTVSLQRCSTSILKSRGSKSASKERNYYNMSNRSDPSLQRIGSKYMLRERNCCSSSKYFPMSSRNCDGDLSYQEPAYSNIHSCFESVLRKPEGVVQCSRKNYGRYQEPLFRGQNDVFQHREYSSQPCRSFQNEVIEQPLPNYGIDIQPYDSEASANAQHAECVQVILSAVVINFLEDGKYKLHTVKFLKAFLMFLPNSLIDGFVYLKKYTETLSSKIVSIDQLMNAFLACCVISHKFSMDRPIFNIKAIQEMYGISLKDFNYLEALIFNRLKYNAFVTPSEHNRALNKILGIANTSFEHCHCHSINTMANNNKRYI